MQSGNYKADNRLVAIINTFPVPYGHDPKHYTYEEVFKGQKYVVPGGGKKELVLPYLLACRFLSAPSTQGIFDPFPDGSIKNPETGEFDKSRLGKPLRIVELTPEEKALWEKNKSLSTEIVYDEPFVPETRATTAVPTEEAQNEVTMPKRETRRKVSSEEMAKEVGL